METDLVSRLMDYEEGTMSLESTVRLFQDLVESRMVWQLPGHYRCTAAVLIDAGLVKSHKTTYHGPKEGDYGSRF